MDITPARLTSLLNEALTPQPMPSTKADPATAALVEALVQPPAPAVQAAQFAVQALAGSLVKAPAQSSQRQSSSAIEDAYRAVMEADVDADETPARSPTGRITADADQTARGFVQPQPAFVNGAARPIAVAAPLSFSPSVAPTATVLVAANGNAQWPRGAAIRPAGHAPRSEPGQASLWAISVVTAIVSAVTTTIVVLLLRCGRLQELV